MLSQSCSEMDGDVSDMRKEAVMPLKKPMAAPAKSSPVIDDSSDVNDVLVPAKKPMAAPMPAKKPMAPASPMAMGDKPMVPAKSAMAAKPMAPASPMGDKTMAPAKSAMAAKSASKKTSPFSDASSDSSDIGDIAPSKKSIIALNPPAL